MENFITLTEKITNEILSYYETTKLQFEKLTNYEDYEDDWEYEEENMIETENFQTNLDEFMEDNFEEYENKVFKKVIEYINNSKYKNIAYLIIMQDAWEYLKTKQIINMELFDYQQSMLDFLENWDLKHFFSKIKESEEFSIDLFVLFIEYHYTHEIENRMVNRKLIELANKDKNYDKFKIKIIDDIGYQYKKTRKLH